MLALLIPSNPAHAASFLWSSAHGATKLTKDEEYLLSLETIESLSLLSSSPDELIEHEESSPAQEIDAGESDVEAVDEVVTETTETLSHPTRANLRRRINQRKRNQRKKIPSQLQLTALQWMKNQKTPLRMPIRLWMMR